MEKKRRTKSNSLAQQILKYLVIINVLTTLIVRTRYYLTMEIKLVRAKAKKCEQQTVLADEFLTSTYSKKPSTYTKKTD